MQKQALFEKESTMARVVSAIVHELYPYQSVNACSRR